MAQQTDIPPKNGASKWLNRKLTEAKRQYLFASFFTLLSAGCFVGFSWYLSQFAALALKSGMFNGKQLAISIGFLAGRYLFAHCALILNYRCGEKIVSKLKTEAYPQLLNNNEPDSTTAALYLTKIADDLKLD